MPNNIKLIEGMSKNDYGTPAVLVRAIEGKVLAGRCFTLDVCAVVENAKCDRFFAPPDTRPRDLQNVVNWAPEGGGFPKTPEAYDGLSQSWGEERCWMNPPYSGGLIDAWLEAAIENWRWGATVAALVPASTDTKWFHRLILPFAEVWYLQGRVRYEGAPASAQFANIVALYHHGAATPEASRGIRVPGTGREPKRG